MLMPACGAPVPSADAGPEAAVPPDCRPVPMEMLAHRSSASDVSRRSDNWIAGGPGTIDEALVRAAIRRKREALRECYDRQRACNPHLNGVLGLRLRIDVTGAVRVETEADDPALAATGVTACAIERLESLSFAATPPSGGEASFAFPLTFLPPARRTER